MVDAEWQIREQSARAICAARKALKKNAKTNGQNNGVKNRLSWWNGRFHCSLVYSPNVARRALNLRKLPQKTTITPWTDRSLWEETESLTLSYFFPHSIDNSTGCAEGHELWFADQCVRAIIINLVKQSAMVFSTMTQPKFGRYSLTCIHFLKIFLKD